MDKNSEKWLILRKIYLFRDEKITNRKIADATGVPIVRVPALVNRLMMWNYIEKRYEGKKVFYSIPKKRREFIKVFLEKHYGDEDG